MSIYDEKAGNLQTSVRNSEEHHTTKYKKDHIYNQMKRFVFNALRILEKIFIEFLETPTLIAWMLYCFGYINGYIFVLLALSVGLKDTKLRKELHLNTLENKNLVWDLKKTKEIIQKLKCKLRWYSK